MLAIKKASPAIDEAFSTKCAGSSMVEHLDATRDDVGSSPTRRTI